MLIREITITDQGDGFVILTVTPRVCRPLMESWLGAEFRYLVFDNGKGQRLVSVSLPSTRTDDLVKLLEKIGLAVDLVPAPRWTKGRM